MNQPNGPHDRKHTPTCFRVFALVVFSAVVLVAITIILLFALAVILPSKEKGVGGRRVSTHNNLKILGLVCKMYAHDHDDYFPGLSQYRDIWTMDIEAVTNEYLTDPIVLVDVNHAGFEERRDRIAELWEAKDLRGVTYFAAENFMYLGFLVRDEEDLNLLIEHRAQLWPNRDGTGADLQLLRELGMNDGDTEQSSVPLFCELKGDASSAAVLFLDGT